VDRRQPTSWSERRDRFVRRHPILLLWIVLALAFLTAPLMIAASKMTAVLYQDF
jgi:hypothetical protein